MTLEDQIVALQASEANLTTVAGQLLAATQSLETAVAGLAAPTVDLSPVLNAIAAVSAQFQATPPVVAQSDPNSTGATSDGSTTAANAN